MNAFKKGDARRRVRALELRLAGATQAEAAAAVGITERMVRRYESDLRRGRSPALTKVSAALLQEFRAEERSRARARILGQLASVAIQASRESLERIKLDQLRAAPVEADEPLEDAHVRTAPGPAVEAAPAKTWVREAPLLSCEARARIAALLADAGGRATAVDSVS